MPSFTLYAGNKRLNLFLSVLSNKHPKKGFVAKISVGAPVPSWNYRPPADGFLFLNYDFQDRYGYVPRIRITGTDTTYRYSGWLEFGIYLSGFLNKMSVRKQPSRFIDFTGITNTDMSSCSCRRRHLWNRKSQCLANPNGHFIAVLIFLRCDQNCIP
jgi:hypothetical protein